MTSNYQTVLASAEEQIAKLEERKAKLEEIISTNKSVIGELSEARSLCDAIRIVVRDSGEFLSRKQILEKLKPFGRGVNPLSVCTALCRLVKEQELIRGKPRAGRIGYMWNPAQKCRKRSWGDNRQSQPHRKLTRLYNRKAHLESVIFGIQLAFENSDQSRSLTDSVHLVLKATEQFITRRAVLERVKRSHGNVKLRSVSTILSRMVAKRQAVRGKTPAGRIGYKWNALALPREQRGAHWARKRLARRQIGNHKN